MELALSKSVKMVLVYISGYISRNDVDEYDTQFYYDEFGEFTKEIIRGGCQCQWVIYCYVFFHHIMSSVCRTSFINITMMIEEFYGFENIDKFHGKILTYYLTTIASFTYLDRQKNHL